MKIKAWIPNGLTLFRIGLVVAIALIMTELQGSLSSKMIWGSILGMTGMVYATDFLDGKLARKWNVGTSFGEKLDIIADLFYIVTVSAILVSQGKMPVMILVLVIAEFLVFFGSSVIKVTKPAGRVFFFDYCGRITAVYYYSVPLIYFLIGHLDDGMFQRGMSYAASLLCIVLTVAAIGSRVSLVAGQRSSDKALCRYLSQKSS